MASRTEISSDQKSTMKRFFDNGMTSLKEKQKIEDCSKETGLDSKIIQNYIGNCKRNASGVQKAKSTNKPQMQGPNAYSYFVSKMPRGSQDKTEYLKACSQKWKLLSVEQKAEYATSAKLVRNDPNKGMSRDDLISVHVKAVYNSVNALEKLGVELGGVIVDPKKKDPPYVFGSDKSFNFFKEMSTEYEIKKRGGDLFASDMHTKKDRLQLKTDVRKFFNDLWAKAGGRPERVPYSEIKAGQTKVTVSGLPESINFKDPSDYSRTQLLEILKVSNSISLRIEKRQQRKVVATATVIAPEENLPQEQPQPAAENNEDDVSIEVVVAAVPSEVDVANVSSEVAVPFDMSPSTSELRLEKAEVQEDSGTTRPIMTIELASGAEVAEDILNKISEEPGLLEQVMTAEGDSLNRIIELKQEAIKKEGDSSGKTGKRKRKGAKTFTKKKKSKTDTRTYTIKRITDMKVLDGKRYFKIKWVGYKDETYEPEENINKKIIENFLAQKAS